MTYSIRDYSHRLLGVTRDIPIIGTVVALTRATLAIRDRLFLNKLVHFLTELHVVPAEQRESMIRRANESGRFRVTVGEKLLYLLDRCEDHQTSRVVAILFKAFLQERISYDEFLKLAHAADRMMVQDLIAFANSGWYSIGAEDAGGLINTGLVEFSPLCLEVERQTDRRRSGEYVVDGGDLELTVTELGRKLREILGPDKAMEAENDKSSVR